MLNFTNLSLYSPLSIPPRHMESFLLISSKHKAFCFDTCRIRMLFLTNKTTSLATCVRVRLGKVCVFAATEGRDAGAVWQSTTGPGGQSHAGGGRHTQPRQTLWLPTAGQEVCVTCHSHMSLALFTLTCHSHMSLPHVALTCHSHMSLPHVTITCHYHMSLPHVTITCHSHRLTSQVNPTCHSHVTSTLLMS